MNEDIKNRLISLSNRISNKIDKVLIDEIKRDYSWRIEVLIESGMTREWSEQFYIDTQLENYRNGYKKEDQDRDARIEKYLNEKIKTNKYEKNNSHTIGWSTFVRHFLQKGRTNYTTHQQ